MAKRWLIQLSRGSILCIAMIAIVLCLGVAGSTLSLRVALAVPPQAALEGMRSVHSVYLPFTNWRASYDIYTINVDGTGLTPLTSTLGNECYPTWSPDGSKIAFAGRKGGHFVISTMDADGSNVHDLFEPDLTQSVDNVECAPAWSPDGARIAFTTSRDGNLEVYVMDADGSNQRNLTKHPASDYFPAWSPDGSEIAFTSDRDGNAETYLFDVKNGQVTKLLDSPEDEEIGPQWIDGGESLVVMAKTGKEQGIKVIDRQKKDVKILHPGRQVRSGSVCPLGSNEVALSDGYRVFALNLESGSSRTIMDSPLMSPTDPVRYYVPISSHHGQILMQISAPMTPDLPRPGWLYVCADGQLVSPRATMSRCDNVILIFPQVDELALVHSGPKWQGTYATVRPDGHIHYVEPSPKEISPVNKPRRWPFLDEQGHLAMPLESTILAREDAGRNPTPIPPANTIGWAFLLADGGLLPSAPSMPEQDYVIWIVRNGRGLDLVRSGPRSACSLYAVVNPDRSIKATSPDTVIASWWPFIDEEGSLVSLRGGVLDEMSQASVPITIHKDGSGSMPATLSY